MTLKKEAKIAGILYLIFAVVAAFGIMYPETILSQPDALTNIILSKTVFRLAIASNLIGQVIFIALGVVLYNMFKATDITQARLLLAIIVASVAVMFIIILNQIGALIVLSGAPYLSGFESIEIKALAMFFLDFYSQSVTIIGIFWGLWLLPFGILVYKSDLAILHTTSPVMFIYAGRSLNFYRSSRINER